MNQAHKTFVQLFIVFVFAFTCAAPSSFAKAYFATEDEMIERAEAIAIVDISRVENAETKAEPFSYSEIAYATVQHTLKGSLPQTVKLYGGESFICAQVHFMPGRYLVFLTLDHDFLVGCNWQLSVRPIKDTLIEWYVPGERLKLSWQKLDTVLGRIKNTTEKPKDK